MKNFMGMGLVAMVFMLAVAMPTALGATNITNCTGSISGDVFELQNDISTNGTSCLSLGNDTVLDGNGYTIYFSGEQGINGVDNKSNFTIRDVNIVFNGTGENNDAGIWWSTNVSDVLIQNVVFNQTNLSAGINGIRLCVDGNGTCDNYTLNNITITNNGSGHEGMRVGVNGAGYAVSYLRNWNVTDVVVYAHSRGFEFVNTENLALTNCTVRRQGNSGGNGIALSNVTDSVLQNLVLDGGETNWTSGRAIETYTSGNNITVSDVEVFGWNGGVQFTNIINLNVDNYTVRRQGNASGDGLLLSNVTNATLTSLVLDGGETDWTDGLAINVFLGNNITIGDVEAFDWNDGISFSNVLVGWIDNAEIYDIAITESRGYAVSLWETEKVLLSDIVSNRTACDAFSFGGVARTTDDVIAGGLEAYDIINDVCGGFAFIGADNITISNSKVGNATAVMALSDFFNDTNTNITIEAGEYYDYDQPTSISGNISNVVFNVSVWDTYTGCDVNDGDNIGNTPFEVNGSYNLSDTYPITLCFTNYTDFNDSSTNLSAESDLSNVTDLTLATLDTVVEWSGSGLDVKNKSLNTLVNLSSNYAEVNSTELPTLDTTANITFYGVSYSDTDHYRVLRDGTVCSDCTKLSADPVKFSVTGFSNYTTESYTPTDGLTAIEQQPILAVIPIVLIGALLIGLIGSITSGVLDIRQLITLAVFVAVAIAFVGVMYLV